MRGDLVQIAAEIGIMAAQSSTASDGPATVLALLQDATDAVAGQIDVLDPATQRFDRLVTHGYEHSVSEELRRPLVDSKYGLRVLNSPLPMLIDDPPFDFRESAHWRDQLGPAGFRDGMSMAIRTRDGRLTGLVHLNADRQEHFGESGRQYVASLTRALSLVSDVTALPLAGAQLGPEFRAVQIRESGAVLDLEGHEATPFAADERVLATARRFRSFSGHQFEVCRRFEGAIHQVRFLRVAAADGERRVLVTSRLHPQTYGLSERELEVLTAVATGESNQLIADALYLSTRTVASHVENARAKLDAPSRAGAVAIAMRDGLLWLGEPAGPFDPISRLLTDNRRPRLH